ncbi:receptor activity-modifying protein 1-like [Clupea harengus]|uniref:Receptor activity-modifying protein 1-like n=1 Tax=Clupea harengus TaxID=7950 RepID=A0A6P8EVC1_CLUHA|nr:receptor activity-modifying protein 1-like [Clupea harengus]XP_031415860.1 receptor activity-modifying protein 1-like [Clupea harengus]
MVNYLSSLSARSLIICLAIIGLVEAKHLASCDRVLFHTTVHHHCISHFNHSMEASDYQKKCPWPSTRVPYVILTQCLEQVAKITRCVEPSLKDKIFLGLHQAYFSLCTRMQDPAVPVLLLLILPCIVTTLLLPLFCFHIATNQ